MKMSRPKLIELLKAHKGASIVTIIASTKPDLKKTDNPFWNGKNWTIRKISKVNGIINFSYEKAVNKGLLKEASGTVPLEYFKAEPRKWGNRIEGTPLVEHNNNMYLEMKVQNVLDVVYLDENNKEIDRAVLKPFEKPKSPGRQGLDNPVILRDYNVASLVEVHMGGQIISVT